MASGVDPDVWNKGFVLAYVTPKNSDITYAQMDALCARLHVRQPDVKFDNRAWLGAAHYVLYYGDADKARAAFEAESPTLPPLSEGYEWVVPEKSDTISAPQFWSRCRDQQ